MDASYESILTILQKMYIKYREDKDEEIVGFNTTVELVKVDDSELCQLPPPPPMSRNTIAEAAP